MSLYVTTRLLAVDINLDHLFKTHFHILPKHSQSNPVLPSPAVVCLEPPASQEARHQFLVVSLRTFCLAA